MKPAADTPRPLKFKEIVGSKYDVVSVALTSLRQRVTIVIVLIVLSSLLILGRIFYISSKPPLSEHDKNILTHQEANLIRADILDCNGMILATSLPTVSVYANGKDILDVDKTLSGLKKVFPDLNYQKIELQIKSRKKFFWIKRHITPKQQESLLSLGITGIYFIKTERRLYPDRNLVSHVLGGTDIDNVGIAGIELYENARLIKSLEPLKLSIDIRIQHAVRDELINSMKEFRAVGATGIFYDIESGETLAMVSLPDFDPNQYSKSPNINKFNKCTCAVMEPGSTAKIFNTAMALESGKFKIHDTIDVTTPLTIGKFTIKDYHPQTKPLTVEEVFKYSSNIGSGRIALSVGGKVQQRFFKDVGLFSSIEIELPELQSPLYPKTWREPTVITASYGYGIAVTPMHMVRAVAGILNQGVLIPPTLIKDKNKNLKDKNRIVSSKTSKIIARLLRLVVQEGTSKKADVQGYQVIGKTGTSEKLDGKTYNKKANLCFFIGAIPMEKPKYLIFIMLDEPKATPTTFGFAAAGWNAAPSASRILSRIGSILDLTAHK